MSDVVKRLREERASIWNQMTGMLKDAETRDGGLSGELGDQYNKAEADLEGKTKEIESRERADAIERKLSAPRSLEAATSGPVASTEEARAAAFDKYIRRGMNDIPTEERGLLEYRDLSDTTGSAGGFTVPQGFLEKITERLKYYGNVREVANVINTVSGQPLPWPGNDDTGNVGSILAENATISNLDVVFTQRTLNAYVYTSGLVRVPNTLLNDTAFDIPAWLAKKFGQRLGRIQNTHFTNGTGTAQPLGFADATNGLVGTQAGTTFATGNTVTMTYAGLVSAVYKLDRAYRTNASWMMSDGAVSAARQVVFTSTGIPVWQPSVNAGEPDRLLGYPINVDSDLVTPAANSYSTFFGDWKQAYIIRDVVGVQMVRLNERYADVLQTGFFAFMRTDARVDDANAATWLRQSAT